MNSRHSRQISYTVQNKWANGWTMTAYMPQFIHSRTENVAPIKFTNTLLCQLYYIESMDRPLLAYCPHHSFVSILVALERAEKNKKQNVIHPLVTQTWQNAFQMYFELKHYVCSKLNTTYRHKSPSEHALWATEDRNKSFAYAAMVKLANLAIFEIKVTKTFLWNG